jgi:hypothetical protein
LPLAFSGLSWVLGTGVVGVWIRRKRKQIALRGPDVIP